VQVPSIADDIDWGARHDHKHPLEYNQTRYRTIMRLRRPRLPHKQAFECTLLQVAVRTVARDPYVKACQA
jgi:hypothetical protein